LWNHSYPLNIHISHFWRSVDALVDLQISAYLKLGKACSAPEKRQRALTPEPRYDIVPR
jgi:hypothetical protein